VLPSPAEFDAHLEEPADLVARLDRIGELTAQLDVLRDRLGRGRALTILAIYEGGRRQDAVMEVTGLSRARVAQLLADARLWRKHDALAAQGRGET
jgi:hypothetical protein